MNPVDQRSEFCRPECRDREICRSEIYGGEFRSSRIFEILEFRWGIFAENFAENYENPAGTDPPRVDLRSTDFAVSVLQNSYLWSTGFSSFSASAPCRPPARINSRDLLNLVLQ